MKAQGKATRQQAIKLLQCNSAVAQCRALFARAFLAGDKVTALVAATRWRENVAVAVAVAEGEL
jgi:hypothetical protein